MDKLEKQLLKLSNKIDEKKDVQNPFIKFLKEQGIWYILPTPGFFIDGRPIPFKKGTPDCISCINGKFIAFEFKGDNTGKNNKHKLSKFQQQHIDHIDKCGGKTYIVDYYNLENVKNDIIKQMKGGN